MNLGDIAIWNIQGVDYRFIISGISKSEAINLMQYIDLTEESGTLWNINFIITYKNGERNLNVWWYWKSCFIIRSKYWDSISI